MGVTDHIQISFGLGELFIFTNFLSNLHQGDVSKYDSLARQSAETEV